MDQECGGVQGSAHRYITDVYVCSMMLRGCTVTCVVMTLDQQHDEFSHLMTSYDII